MSPGHCDLHLHSGSWSAVGVDSQAFHYRPTKPSGIPTIRSSNRSHQDCLLISNGVTLHAVLTHADPVPGSGGFFTLQSTLSTSASATTNGTMIVCREGFTGTSGSVTLQLQGQLVSITKFSGFTPFPSIF